MRAFCHSILIVVCLLCSCSQDKEPQRYCDYEVSFRNIAGQEITKKLYLPDGINEMKVISHSGSYNLFVIYNNGKSRLLVQPAVIDIFSFKKIKESCKD